MYNKALILREKIIKQFGILDKRSVQPSWTELHTEGKDLLNWKENNEIKGLWEESPLMITATLDDAWGIGLKLIHLYADIAGLDYIHLGLMLTSEQIIDECIKKQPDILGLTVLRSDMQDEFEKICRKIPDKTRIVAWGSVIKSEFAECEKGYYSAENAFSFIKYLLEFDYGK